MKRFQKFVLGLLVVAAVLPSCKKGDDDPFLSLRSRKGRVAGDWTVDARVKTETQSNSSSSTSTTTTTTISGSNWTQTHSNSSDVHTGAVTFTFKFDKDGKWSSVYELTETDNTGGVTTTSVEHTESSGIWNFLGKIGDAKNKENMSVSTTSETTKTTFTSTFFPSSTNVTTKTYSENENVEIWKITELKNKEMMVEMTIDNSSVTNSGSTSKTSGSTTMTLKQ